MTTPKNQVNLLSQIIKIVIILLITAGLVVYFILIQPKVKKKKINLLPSTVSVIEAEKASGVIWIKAMGTVTAKRNLNIVAEVGGRITWINEKFYPGGIFAQDEILVKIDKTDYEIALETAKSSLATSQKNLLVEEGSARSAKAIEDLSTTSASKQAKELRLRIPHIEAAEANLRAAEKSLEKSELDLIRTEVKAPFPIMINTETIEIGHYVTRLSSIGQAVGTNTFWVEINILMDKLKYLKIPGVNATQGSKAIATLQGIENSKPREGRIIRILGDLDESGRMARLLVAINDPLGLESNFTEQPLLINSYVQVDLEGSELSHMIKLQREYLREGDTIWALGNDNRLTIKSVDIGWRDNDNVYISSGLQAGDRVITSSNFTPIEGMKLNITGNKVNNDRKQNK